VKPGWSMCCMGPRGADRHRQPAVVRRQPRNSLRRLEHDVDAWVATADPASGSPYLVPLSFLWDGRHLLVATPSASPTSRNLQATGRLVAD
jgi:hypothetical protein